MQVACLTRYQHTAWSREGIMVDTNSLGIFLDILESSSERACKR